MRGLKPPGHVPRDPDPDHGLNLDNLCDLRLSEGSVRGAATILAGADGSHNNTNCRSINNNTFNFFV